MSGNDVIRVGISGSEASLPFKLEADGRVVVSDINDAYGLRYVQLDNIVMGTTGTTGCRGTSGMSSVPGTILGTTGMNGLSNVQFPPGALVWVTGAPAPAPAQYTDDDLDRVASRLFKGAPPAPWRSPYAHACHCLRMWLGLHV